MEQQGQGQEGPNRGRAFGPSIYINYQRLAIAINRIIGRARRGAAGQQSEGGGGRGWEAGGAGRGREAEGGKSERASFAE